jgi:hypothetical protein
MGGACVRRQKSKKQEGKMERLNKIVLLAEGEISPEV